MLTVEQAKAETMKALGLPESDVDYITETLLKEYEAAKLVEKVRSTMSEDVQKRLRAANLAVGYGAYGNSLVFGPTSVSYKQGPRGTPNYGCGNDPWTWRKDPGDTFTPQGLCPGNRQEYLLYCPTCI